jgi:hypothetical protein
MPERHVTAGEVAVTVRARGYLTLTRRVTVTPGQQAAEVFRLKRLDGESASGAVSGGGTEVTPPGAGALQPVGQGMTVPPQSPDSEANRDRAQLRMAAWGGAVAGGLSLAAGVTFLLLGESIFHKFDNHCFIDDNTGAIAGGADCVDLDSTVHRDRVIGVVGLAVGGALAATSAVLFLKSRDTGGIGTTSHALACAPTGTAGVACAWRF